MPATPKKTAKTDSEPKASSSGRKPTLSPTRYATYLACGVKYKYVYIDKIGRFYTKARAGYSFGSTLHHVLQEFHQAGATQTPDEMVAQLTESWIGAGYQDAVQEQTHREAGTQMVQAYHAAHQVRIEAQVETLATEKTITCDMGRFKLSGRIDRLDRHPDGRLEIIDYKSGRRETTSEEVANSLAMSIYQLILKRLHPENTVFATIYALRSGATASAELEGDALEEFAAELVELGHHILDEDWERLRPVPLDICPDCEFLPRCSRYWEAIARRKGQTLDAYLADALTLSEADALPAAPRADTEELEDTLALSAVLPAMLPEMDLQADAPHTEYGI